MSFPFNVYLAAFAGGLICSAASFPFWNKWALRAGHVDDPGHRKIHHTPVSLAGGLTVMTGFFVPLILGALAVTFWPFSHDLLPRNVETWLEYGLSRRGAQLAAIMAGAMGMVLLGWLDDRHELSPGVKFSGQVLIALLVAASGIRITLFIPNPLVNAALTVFWILAITNAFNFLDNMNGLCAGLGIIASWCCAWAAATQGQYLVAILAFAICGAVSGFFPFNFPRASAFLGDAGSHLIGFLIAVLSILPNYYSAESASKWAVLMPLFILAAPLFDLVSVVIIRLRLGQPVWLGDNNHISHRLNRRGFTRTTAVLFILLANAATGATGLLLLASR